MRSHKELSRKFSELFCDMKTSVPYYWVKTHLYYKCVFVDIDNLLTVYRFIINNMFLYPCLGIKSRRKVGLLTLIVWWGVYPDSISVNIHLGVVLPWAARCPSLANGGGGEQDGEVLISTRMSSPHDPFTIQLRTSGCPPPPPPSNPPHPSHSTQHSGTNQCPPKTKARYYSF